VPLISLGCINGPRPLGPGHSSPNGFGGTAWCRDFLNDEFEREHGHKRKLRQYWHGQNHFFKTNPNPALNRGVKKALKK
jgi:hypothetical protein